MQIFQGTIITCDADNNVYQYLVEEKGKIVFVGNELPQEYNDCKNIVTLGKRALVPSFGDGHIHYSNWALIAMEYFDVRTARNFSDVDEIIKTFVKERKGKIGKALVGFGISSHCLEEKKLPTKIDLDSYYSEKPMAIVCYDGHSFIANSKMMEKFPKKVRESRGFDEETGLLIREAFYLGLDYFTSLFSLITLIKSIIGAYDILAQRGIGLIHSVESIGYPMDLDVTMALMIGKAKSKKNNIQTRMFFQTMDVSKALKRKLPRIGGCFATALDGAFATYDAGLIEPYTNNPESKGILYYSDDEVADFAKEANRAELQIEFHTIGDAAVKQAIDAIEIALQDYPREDHRHSIIHVYLISDEDIQRCVNLGISITAQPAILVSPLEPVWFIEELIGDRAKTSSPYRKIIDAGIHLSGGSDGPVTHPDPIAGIYGACNHPYDSSQNLTIQEALKMYTYEVAWMSFDEKKRGSLEKGKLADMVILNENPLSKDPKDLRQLKVEQLYLQGKKYKPGMSLGSMLWNAMRARKETI
ncbi:MAG: amidohydrolase family protein [Candidatus Heimdallarchaeota archaeon]|nr:amidohydrolase family protein [Candidatus Heimdallarchaeota archaeon]MBY8995062.1 amidohydrolase family protein [Candidatus Heimdallarchaeota archaeon]